MGFVGFNLHGADDPPFWQDPHRLHEATVRLLGHFSSVQDLADTLVRRYLHEKAPGLTYLVEKRVLKTMRDEDRVKAVREVAKALGPAEHLSELGTAFDRVRDVRNYLAHTRGVSVLLDADGAFLQVVTTDRKRAEEVGRLDAAALGQCFLDCEWIEDQLLWTAQQTELLRIMDLGQNVIELKQPPRTPPQWTAGARPRPENLP
jgi:hypothetical protein